MRLCDGKNPGSLRPAVVATVVLVLAAFACVSGCGTSTSRTTRFLVVSDSDNNRVLIYDTPLNNGQSASVVLGQASLTTSTVGLSATGMNEPSNTAEDSAGNLYVSDISTTGSCNSNHRSLTA